MTFTIFVSKLMNDNSGDTIIFFIFVFLLFRAIVLNIITFLIKEVISLLNKFLNFNNIFSSSLIIRSNRVTGGKGRRRSASTYIRIIIIIIIIKIRIRI